MSFLRKILTPDDTTKEATLRAMIARQELEGAANRLELIIGDMLRDKKMLMQRPQKNENRDR